MNVTTKCPKGTELRAYIDGKLSADPLRTVEAHLLDCPLCDAAVDGFVKYPDTIPSLTDIQRMTKDSITTSQKTAATQFLGSGTIHRLFPYLAVAVISLLLVFTWYNYRQDQVPQRLFATYFTPIPQTDFSNQRAVAVVQPKMDEILSQALSYHLAGDYTFALTSWRAFLEDYENPDFRAYLYAASAALATGKDDVAAYYLNQIPLETSGEFGEEVNWYRALHALKTSGPDAATKILNAMEGQIANPVVRENRIKLLRSIEH